MSNETKEVSMLDFAKVTLYFEMLFSTGVFNDKLYSQYADLIKDLQNEGLRCFVVTKEFIYQSTTKERGRILLIEQMRDIRKTIIETLSRASGNSVESINQIFNSCVCSEFSSFISK